MIDDGKLQDVLFQSRDSDNDIFVWADEGLLNTISKVPGVNLVYTMGDTLYAVTLDPRYDIEWVKKESEAQIKIKGNGGK